MKINKLIEELLETNDKFVVYEDGTLSSNFNIIINDNKLIVNENNHFKLIYFNLKENNISLDIFIEEGIEVKIEEVYFELLDNTSLDINLYMKKNAKLDYISIKKANGIKALINAYLDKNAYINNKNIFNYSNEVNEVYNVYINDQLANVDMKNVFLNSSGKKQNFDINIYHHVGNSISNLNNYAICKNDSIISINSNGYIDKNSANSSLHQKSKGILLDLNSMISATPLLKIDNFDVVASHGASIGAIDDDELYYLMSRGLSKSNSEKLIVSGFISPFTDEIDDGKFKDYIKNMINFNL